MEHEFNFTQADFDSIRQQLYTLSGIRLSESKQSMVYSRLARRLRALNIVGFSHYLQYLKQTPTEVEHFINALTTNLTSFFREPHHFRILAEHLKRHPSVKTIWCAASSTGEEPYSIAMTVAKVRQSFDSGITIIASDIDSTVLKTAESGIYPLERLTDLSVDSRKQFFHKGRGAHNGYARVVPELRKMVSFRQLNLLSQQWNVRAPIDVIFCRNVMIYFDKTTQESIFKRMMSMLPKQGLYFAGHSEQFSQLKDIANLVDKTTYQPVTGCTNGRQ
ncbi:MAG: chemotaxis protein CheR [Chromatiaceae bacterium]|nr:chemotaxis protein CheR [Chromatiaceae bacterium]